MANITPEKFNELLKNAPKGVDAATLRATLEKRGHTVAQTDITPTAQPDKTPGFLQSIAQSVARPLVSLPAKPFQFIEGGLQKGLVNAANATGLTGKSGSPFTVKTENLGKDVFQEGIDLPGLGNIKPTTATPTHLAGDALQVASYPVGGGFLKNIAMGAAQFGGQALSDDKNAQGVTTDAAIGAGIAAALHIPAGVVSMMPKDALNKTADKFVNFALKVPSKKAGQGIGEAFFKRGFAGKPLEFIQESTAAETEQIGKEIEKKLGSAKNLTTNPGQFIKDVAKSINRERGSRLSPDSLKARIASFAPDFAPLLEKDTLTPIQANNLRVAIDKNLKEATHLGKELTGEQEALKKVANELRRMLQKNTDTAALFKQESEAIRINTLAEDAIKKAATTGKPGVTDLVAAGIGGGFGGIPGAAMAIGAERLARSPQAQTLIGAGVKSIGPYVPAIQKTGNAARLSLFQALKAALDQ